MEERSGYKKRLITWAVVYAIIILAILLIANISVINRGFLGILRILRPVIIGLVLSYLGNPIFVLFERRLFSRLRPQKFRRALSLICAYLVLLLIIVLLLLLILPQLVNSISSLAANFDGYLVSAVEYANGFLSKLNGYATQYLGVEQLFTPLEVDALKQLFVNFFDLTSADVGISFEDIDVQQIMGMLGEALSWVTDTILGLFISIYLLSSKEKRGAQIMKFRRAIFSERFNQSLTRLFATAHRSFGGFLEGKVIDSLIIGILTYIVISIFNIPYAILIATIVGLTNIIPVVGPFIGAIPSAIIIFAASPNKVILFLLIILIIQQIDGNIIGPKLLGDNTSISPLCVIIAVTVMGSIWGFTGMILGVPLFATALELAELSIIDRLQKKGLPSGLANYYAADTVVDHVRDSRQSRFGLRLHLEKEYLHVKKMLEKDVTVSLTFNQKLSYRFFRLCCRLHLFDEPNEDDIAASTAKEALREAEKASERRFAADVEQSTPDASDS